VSAAFVDPGPPNEEFTRPASRERLQRVVEALRARGFAAVIADDGDHARRLVLDAIPEGAEVYRALSESLKELGITPELDESGRYESVQARVARMSYETQADEIRKAGASPDYVVGSAHAITDDGEILIASGSGNQLGAYAYRGKHAILVVGHQKIVSDIAEGLRRIREYCLPREFVRVQSIGYPGTRHGKTLILHDEPGGRVRVILVPETLGY
jgi:hypothetical protein